MLIAMAGLPGSGKSTVAACLAEQLDDPGVVEQPDRPATFLGVEDVAGAGERSGPIARHVYVAASRSYGWPSAAGGMLRPTTPARITIVTRYGKAS